MGKKTDEMVELYLREKTNELVWDREIPRFENLKNATFKNYVTNEEVDVEGKPVGMKKRYRSWTKLDCSQCERPSWATRTEPQEIDADKFICGDCEMYNRGSEEAEEATRNARYERDKAYADLEKESRRVEELERELRDTRNQGIDGAHDRGVLIHQLRNEVGFQKGELERLRNRVEELLKDRSDFLDCLDLFDKVVKRFRGETQQERCTTDPLREESDAR